MATASDPIWHIPFGVSMTFSPGKKPRTHYCSQPVVATTQRRDVLDPCAIGKCRYCGRRLP